MVYVWIDRTSWFVLTISLLQQRHTPHSSASVSIIRQNGVLRVLMECLVNGNMKNGNRVHGALGWAEHKTQKTNKQQQKKDKKKKFVFTLVEWMDLYLLHADACDNNHHQRIGDERTNSVALLSNRNFYLLLTSLSLQLQFKHPTAPRNAQIFWWKFLMAELLTVHTYLPISIFISFMTHIIRHIRIISVDSHTILSVRR